MRTGVPAVKPGTPKHVRDFIRGAQSAWPMRAQDGVDFHVSTDLDLASGWNCTLAILSIDLDGCSRGFEVPTQGARKAGRDALLEVVKGFENSAADEPTAQTKGAPSVCLPNEVIVWLPNEESVKIGLPRRVDVVVALNDLATGKTIDELEPAQRDLLEAQIPGGLERVRRSMDLAQTEGDDDGEE